MSQNRSQHTTRMECLFVAAPAAVRAPTRVRPGLRDVVQNPGVPVTAVDLRVETLERAWG
jgi:hypothetical protein